MITLQRCKTGITTAAACAAMLSATGAFAAPGNKADYSAAKDRIAAEFKADRAACDAHSGNQKDICIEQAKGKESVARAEADYNYSGKADDGTKVAKARADADYAVAKEMCDDKGANAKDVCISEAKAAHDKALADAKMNRKVGEARADAIDTKRDADYKVAAQKCDSLAGDSKSACISAAKTKYGQK